MLSAGDADEKNLFLDFPVMPSPWLQEVGFVCHSLYLANTLDVVCL